MNKNFSETERKIQSILTAGKQFTFNNDLYEIKITDKPTVAHGEPKTDIFCLLENKNTNQLYQLKISIKQGNADFIENKMQPERAEQILGPNWKEIIIDSTKLIADKFTTRQIIFKESQGKSEAGAITLGWKFELMNKLSGALSGKIDLTYKQLIDIYSGTNLSPDKKNAMVAGKTIENSGVANFILIDTGNINTLKDIFMNLQPITSYCQNHPDMYFACKALNYRTFKNKYDGNRPLAVSIEWSANNGKLTPTFNFNNPLNIKGNYVAQKLLLAMDQLGIKNTNDL